MRKGLCTTLAVAALFQAARAAGQPAAELLPPTAGPSVVARALADDADEIATPSDDDGPRLWASAEYLLWWFKKAPNPCPS